MLSAQADDQLKSGLRTSDRVSSVKPQLHFLQHKAGMDNID